MARHVAEQSARCLRAYRENPLLVSQDANIEIATAEGGYGRKQLFELVQNGADALQGSAGRVALILTDDCLYCANEGRSVDLEGVDALLASHLSVKRGPEIGRFGLGFKSVVALSDTPEFFSRSGSFGWNRRLARERIETAVPGVERWPTLRIAEPLDPSVHRASDPILSSLMEWATTVVRIHLDRARADWLHDDLAEFPAEFILFVPHVKELTLEDRSAGSRRVARLEKRAEDHVLAVDGKKSTWRVFATTHRPSKAAASDAGELAHRDEIPLVWAVPVEGRSTVGQFWAFFPTSSYTTLRGILNAPWKTNEDRHDLLSGAFNEEIITDVAAPLIAGAVSRLVDPHDIGSYLEMLPARGRESRSWADGALNEPLYRRLIESRSLPDQHGQMQRPADLHLPAAEIAMPWLEVWESCPTRPSGWVHSSALKTAERRAKAERLHGWHTTDTATWLEALVADCTPEGSATAIVLAARILSESPELASKLRSVPIVLTDDGELVPPIPGLAFLRRPHGRREKDIRYVAASLLTSESVVDALLTLGMTRVDASGRLHALFASNPEGWDPAQWDAFWTSTRDLDPAEAQQILERHLPRTRAKTVRVHTVGGTWRSLASTLLPGEIVPGDGSRDADVTVNLQYHAHDVEFLRLLGAVEAPSTATTPAEPEPWLRDYERDVTRRYYEGLPKRGPRPREDLLVVTGPGYPSPLSALPALSEEGRTRMTKAVLDQEPGLAWTCRHATKAAYPQVEFESPALWMVRRHGRVNTSYGSWEVAYCVGPSLSQFAELLPVAWVTTPQAARLRLPHTLDEVPNETWHRCLDVAPAWDDDARFGDLLAVASAHASAPREITCRIGAHREQRALTDIAIASNAYEFGVLIEHGIPAVFVNGRSRAAQLSAAWQLRPYSAAIDVEIEAQGVLSRGRITDELRPLWAMLTPDQRNMVLCRCVEIEVRTRTFDSRSTDRVTFAVDEETVFWVDTGDITDLVRALNGEFQLQLSEDEVLDLAAEARRAHGRPARGPETPTPPSSGRRAVRFAGTCEVDAAETGRDFQAIAARIIDRLAAVPSVELEVVVDIAANCLDGFPREVIEQVSQAAHELQFDSMRFEDLNNER